MTLGNLLSIAGLLLALIGLLIAIYIWWRRPPAQPGELTFGNLKVEPTNFCNSKNTVCFSLSYFGTGLAFIQSLILDVLAFEKLEKVKMTGMGATPQEYRYRIHLSPRKERHQLNESPLSYKDKDIDTFRVEMTSPGGFQYRVCMCAEWHDMAKPSEHRTASTDPFSIKFPIEEIEEAIELTTLSD